MRASSIHTLLALLFALVAFPPRASAAGEQKTEPWRLDASLKTPAWLHLFFTHRSRFESLHSQFRPADSMNEKALSLRTTLLTEFRYRKVALGIELGDHLILARSEQEAGASENPALLANACEAIIGALYLDSGIEPVFGLVGRVFADALAAGDVHARDPKTRFQEWAHAELRQTPVYRQRHDSGIEEDHDRFTLFVEVEGREYGVGTGRTKRAAERAAAADALARLEDDEAADG